MYDLAVIGGGPGGYVAAICGAREGLKTLLVEKDALGGTCLNRGCIPTKCFAHDAKLFQEAKRSPILKGTETLEVDVAQMAARKEGVVQSLVAGVGALLRSHGVDVVQGSGELAGPGVLTVGRPDGTRLEYRSAHVILATGSRPATLPFIEVDGRLVQTTDEALDAQQIPGKIVILGGGVIGVEMASIYLNLGCDVTIIEMLPEILHTEDQEVRGTMRALLEKRGATVHRNARASDVRISGDEVELDFRDATGAPSRVKAERLLVASGRAPVLDGIRAERLGLAMQGPFVKVNARLETSLRGVYAIGDLIGGLMLAHKASAEAEAAVGNVLGRRRDVDSRKIPRCIWGLTEIGAVGLTEEEARATGRRIRIGRFPYAHSGAAQAMGRPDGFVKLIGDSETGEVLGVHIVGEHATDLISESVLAMNLESAVEDMAGRIAPHPTLSENVMEAARDWNGVAIHSPRKSSTSS